MLHQVGVSFDLYYGARKHKIKIYQPPFVIRSIQLVIILQLLSTQFVTNLHRSALSAWTTLTGRMRPTTCDAYYRELSLDKAVPTFTVLFAGDSMVHGTDFPDA